MLEVLVTGRTRRELLRLLWGKGVADSVSGLARQMGAGFSATYRELEAMRTTQLVRCERAGNQLVYRANFEHPHGKLLGQLARLAPTPDRPTDDGETRAWLRAVGAPLVCPPAKQHPPLETVLASALELAHRDATVARVLPLVLWRRRLEWDPARLVAEATRRNERHALGCFLELTGKLGHDPALVATAQRLRDRRRTRTRPFFVNDRGQHALAAARRNTPAVVRRWGYLMNMDLHVFSSLFAKFNPVPSTHQ
jgi:hypothetical protein